MNAPAQLAPGRVVPPFTPHDPDYAARVLASFARQAAMRLIGARLTEISPGRTEIELDYREDLTQQKGYVHGGIVGMIADSACGYAAYSLMPATSSLVTVEYKINLLAPAVGERLVARGEVVKPGRTLSIARAEVFALKSGKTQHVASMQQTLMMLPDTPDVPENATG